MPCGAGTRAAPDAHPAEAQSPRPQFRPSVTPSTGRCEPAGSACGGGAVWCCRSGQERSKLVQGVHVHGVDTGGVGRWLVARTPSSAAVLGWPNAAACPPASRSMGFCTPEHTAEAPSAHGRIGALGWAPSSSSSAWERCCTRTASRSRTALSRRRFKIALASSASFGASMGPVRWCSTLAAILEPGAGAVPRMGAPLPLGAGKRPVTPCF